MILLFVTFLLKMSHMLRKALDIDLLVKQETI